MTKDQEKKKKKEKKKREREALKRKYANYSILSQSGPFSSYPRVGEKKSPLSLIILEF